MPSRFRTDDEELTDPSADVLVVDDQDGNARLLERLLAREGHHVRRARHGAEALTMIASAPPDLVVMDVLMPGLDGFETCHRLKTDPATRLIPVALVTALQDTRDRIRGLEAGADDFVSKPVKRAELTARVRALLRLKRYTDELDSAESVILSLALTIEARDRCTEGHCERLASYASALGAVLGLGADDRNALRRGGFLHDIGKIGVPDSIVLKPARLTPIEYAVMKQHVLIGDRLCGELRSLRRVRPIVRHHHERLDGTGYPDGLRGDAIPLLAQIIGVVDVFDALTTARPYKPALPSDDACRELAHEVQRGWRSPNLVDIFITQVRSGRLPHCEESGVGAMRR